MVSEFKTLACFFDPPQETKDFSCAHLMILLSQLNWHLRYCTTVITEATAILLLHGAQ